MFEMDGYAPYTSALEAEAEAAKQNIFKRIGEWFQRKIDTIRGWFSKEKNKEKKSIWGKLLTAIQGIFNKFKRAKTPEEAAAAQAEAQAKFNEEKAKAEAVKPEERDQLIKDNTAKAEAYAKGDANRQRIDAELKKAEAARKEKAIRDEYETKVDPKTGKTLRRFVIGGKEEWHEDDDEIDVEVEDAIESYRRLERLSENYELVQAIENVQANVDTNCTTAEEAEMYLENIEDEICRFNRDINTLKTASESMAYGYDQNRFNTIAAPAVESLRNSFAQVGFTVNTASGIDQEACESMSYFLKTARNIISNKVDELAGNVAEDYAGEASFLATLTI